MAFFEFLSRPIVLSTAASVSRVAPRAPVVNRTPNRPRLILLLLVLLSLNTPAQAHILSPLLDALIPNVLFGSATKKQPTDESQSGGMNVAIDESSMLINETKTTKSVSSTKPLGASSVLQTSLNEPSLYALMDAEFAAARGEPQRAVTIYKQQSLKDDATAVFERALGLSLRNEDIKSSLRFAQTWQDQNPDHVPAWFYVAHLALKAHDYTLAGETLSRILRYDPRADLSEILIGIYPTASSDQRELLAALQPIDSQQNASLSVLKAGLLYQFNEPQSALVHIDRALLSQPDYVPFITLKADILRKIEPSNTVLSYISQARLRNPSSKNLYLYEIRYLLDLKQNNEAWQLLLEAHNRFPEDEEITLLAALVSLDIEQYRSADQLLNILAKSPAYLDQAYYYLGVSAERQQRFEQAKYYLNGVMQEDLVLAARKKVVAFELLNNNVDAALATLETLRQQFEVFAPESYVLQADVLLQQNETNAALRLLTRASRTYPNSEVILYARSQLLDDVKDYAVKRTLLNHLQALDPKELSYQLSYAQLLLSNDSHSEQGLALASAIIQIRYDDPRYDNELHLQALNLLATNALVKGNYAQVIEYLQTPYDVLPSLRSGVLLLRAYQGLGDTDKVNALLADLQQRFSFGQDNVTDRIQLY